MNNSKLKEELIKTTNVVRAKCKSLKNSKYDEDFQMEESFKPITKPLKEIADMFKEHKPTITQPPPPLILKNPKKDDSDDDDDEMFYGFSDNDNDGYNHNEEDKKDSKGIWYYIQLLESDSKLLDKSYGVYKSNDANSSKIYKIGNSVIIPSHSQITVDDKAYVSTVGLNELLFLKDPDKRNFTSDDLIAYGEILRDSKAYFRNFDEKDQIRGSNSAKYRSIIKPITLKYKGDKNRSGSGISLMQIPKQNIDYIYWDDPNEIVDRLRLLVGSQHAGHSSHNNEIMSIIEELKEANIIV